MPGLVLNLLSAFLYMVNYNVVLPTNAAFCVHIGSSESMAGVIIGCADLTGEACMRALITPGPPLSTH